METPICEQKIDALLGILWEYAEDPLKTTVIDPKFFPNRKKLPSGDLTYG